MDLTKLSDTELKALAFEEIQKREVAAQNIQVILAELEKRSVEPAPKPSK